MRDDEFRKHLLEGVDRFSRRGHAEQTSWKAFAARFSLLAAGFADSHADSPLAYRLKAQGAAGRTRRIGSTTSPRRRRPLGRSPGT
jgi:hypothetical protein